MIQTSHSAPLDIHLHRHKRQPAMNWLVARAVHIQRWRDLGRQRETNAKPPVGLEPTTSRLQITRSTN